MASSTSRLRLAPDDHSGMRTAGRSPKTKWNGPAARPGVSPPGSGAGPANNIDEVAGQCRHTLEEGADMAKRTRGSTPADSRTRDTGVKITPPTHSGPVTTTHTTA